MSKIEIIRDTESKKINALFDDQVKAMKKMILTTD